MKKHGFTIIELIIVMTILSIMFIITRNYFSSENKIYFEGETCINNMYYTIRDLNNAALLGRNRALSGIFNFSGNNIQSPDRYNIVFRPPSNYVSPHFTVSPEAASGLVKSIRTNPLTGGILGTHGGQNMYTNNLSAWLFLYRGTGDVAKTINTNNDTFSIQYFPIWWVNYLAGSGGYTPIKGCVNPEFFVTYAISTAYANTTALRVGFQSSSVVDSKKMIIWHGQWLSGTMAETNTGAINLQVCNKNIECKETHRIFFDTRVGDLFLQKCATYGTNKKCTVWQGGNIN